MTPWKIAMEAAASVAHDACLVPPDGGSPSEQERIMCEIAAGYIRDLSEPPAFRAALEADEALLREALERLNAAPIVGKFGVGLSEYDRMCEALWDYRAENRALLAKLEERLK